MIQIIAQSSMLYKKLKVLGNLSSCMYSYFAGFAQEGRLRSKKIFFMGFFSYYKKKNRVNWYFYIFLLRCVIIKLSLKKKNILLRLIGFSIFSIFVRWKYLNASNNNFSWLWMQEHFNYFLMVFVLFSC